MIQKWKRWVYIGVIGVLAGIFLIGCGKKTEPVQEQDKEPMKQTKQQSKVNKANGIKEEENHEGKAINPLTGLWIDEQAAKRRPVAIMINNLKQALPQSGLSEADIIYETLVEGDITRLMAVFQEFHGKKIGPVRSARHYYLDFALDLDAVYVHYGKSPQALQAFGDLGIDHLEGLSYLDSIMCWRDPIRAKKKGMYEHSVYTNAEKIMKAWKHVKYRTDKAENLQPMFSFSPQEFRPQGENAQQLKLPFSNQHTAAFTYDEDTKSYKRSQFQQPHIDIETHKQLEVKNIIVQYAEMYQIQGDDKGRRDMNLISSGKGIYVSNGKAMPILWEKLDHHTPTQYKDEQGNLLQINKGKTWICIFPDNRKVYLE